MATIKGMPIVLINSIEVGKDKFNNPIYEEQRKTIENVLVAPVISEDVVTQLNLTGKKAVYQIAIPKGDTNIWKNQKVEFFGETFIVIGSPIEGIEENIPGQWHKKVTVECYE